MSQPTDTVQSSRAGRGRHGLAISGVIFVVLLLVAGAVVLLSLKQALRPSHHDSATHRHGHVTRLQLSAEDSVDVAVQPVRGTSEVSVTSTLSWNRERPAVEQKARGRTLRVGASCPSGAHLGFAACHASLTVKVPESLPVKLEDNSGDVHIGALTGPLNVAVSSGNLWLTGTSGATNATVDSGDLHASRLRTDTLTASADSGDTYLTFATAPKRLAIRSDSGDAHLTVPPTASGYRVTGYSSDGERHIAVSVAAGASHRIDAQLDSGELWVDHPD